MLSGGRPPDNCPLPYIRHHVFPLGLGTSPEEPLARRRP